MYAYCFLHYRIFAAKKSDPKADTSQLENQIDNLVYKLYELTYEEVKVIDPNFALSEQEYEAITIRSIMENNIILYSSEAGNVNVNVTYQNDTFWLTQKAIASLFNCSTDNVSLHLKNIFNSGELEQNSVTEEFSATASDGKNYKTKFYNLDAIIAVGYRVNSKQATQFRIWATQTLKEYIIKGFVLNDEMLKNGKPFGKDYFNELLERIREIRSSERRLYQKLGDIFEQCSADYSKNAEETKMFYKMVQNKLH